MKRIGIVGFGFIGASLFREIVTEPRGLEVAFVHNRSRAKAAEVPQVLLLDELSDFASRKPDLIVESAHPDITRSLGEAFLSSCDYMPFSVTALADDGLRERLILSRKAAIVCSSRRARWSAPTRCSAGRICGATSPSRFASTPPTSISPHGRNADRYPHRTVFFDGPVRDIAPLFPATSTPW